MIDPSKLTGCYLPCTTCGTKCAGGKPSMCVLCSLWTFADPEAAKDVPLVAAPVQLEFDFGDDDA